ncbi:restriction endonuclease subunit S [Butyrivibrio fibrisolvens]|uniref:restriction endonuclease subunit S n=1 Tax=Butyrivibrio fibrisolvens TaxID=831 RepID=UPI0004184C7E|nr:restriction endonuclease subunit S [Butyrivibrio fibrisolvens]
MREMRSSDVMCIGEIPKDWQIAKVKNVAEKLTDGTHATYERTMEGRLLLSAKNVTDTGLSIGESESLISEEDYQAIVANGFPQKDDVLLCCVGTIGRCMVYKEEEPIAFQRSVLFIRCNDRILPAFLNYSLKSPSTLAQEQLMIKKSAQEGIYQNSVKELLIALPDLASQQRIVNYLDAKCNLIDSIIAKHEIIIEKLKEYKVSVINEAVTRGLNHNVEMIYSGVPWIGDIPVHWQMVYAKQLFSQRKERAIEGDEQLTASQQYGIISQRKFMEIEGRQVMQVLKGKDILKHVEKGDFVISMRSFQGGLEYSEVTGKISSAYVMLIPNEKYVYDRYYKWLFKSKRYITALQGTSNLIRDGQALRFSNFVQVYLPKFEKDEQKAIADYLDEVCPKIENEIAKRELFLQKLQEYRNALIYEVVTGKKEV